MSATVREDLVWAIKQRPLAGVSTLTHFDASCSKILNSEFGP
jgi:hypothetical protein